MGLWESNSGFGDHVRAQAVDDDLLVINFIPLGVNFGLYRILQMICLENLIREFTNLYKQRDLGQFIVSFV